MQKELLRVVTFPKTAKTDPDIVEIIELTNLCQTFNVLPREGGVLDQNAETMTKMQMVLVAQAKKSDADAERAKRKK
jgi:hypothetical protein